MNSWSVISSEAETWTYAWDSALMRMFLFMTCVMKCDTFLGMQGHILVHWGVWFTLRSILNCYTENTFTVTFHSSKNFFKSQTVGVSLLLDKIFPMWFKSPGPVQPCRSYGTLFVPKYLDFRRRLTFREAQKYCYRSRAFIPWDTRSVQPSYETCTNTMRQRMKTLFSLNQLPVIWTHQAGWRQAPSSTERRHVLCVAGKLGL